MPPSVDPDHLEKREFSMVRRGADPAEVRSALAEAADGLRLLQRRVHELEHQIEVLEGQVPDPGAVDAEREAARAEGLIAGAAEGDAVRASAREAADDVLAQAKEEGRALVQEAQTVRRRMLDDLARRRRSMRQQIEQLQAGRERLLEAYEVVGHTMREATEELAAALPEARAAAERAGHRVPPQDSVEQLEAEIDAARVAGLPIVEREASAPADAEPPSARRRPVAVPLERDVRDMPEVEPVVAEFEGVRVIEDVDDVTSPPGEGAGSPAAAADAATTPPDRATGDDEQAIDEPADDDVASRVVDAQDGASVEGDMPSDGPSEAEGTTAPDTDVPGESDPGEPDAEEPEPDDADLFSRLRRATEAADASEDGDAPLDGSARDGNDADSDADSDDVAGDATWDDDDGFDHPDDAAEPFGVALGVEVEATVSDDTDGRVPAEQELARRLKRLLSDEQNDVLDRLRRTRKRTLDLDDLLEDLDRRVSRYSMAVQPVLATAADTELGSAAAAVDDLAAELAREVAEAIADGVIERLEEDLEIDELSGPIRRLYREWKTDRIGGLAHRYVDAACTPMSAEG